MASRYADEDLQLARLLIAIMPLFPFMGVQPVEAAERPDSVAGRPPTLPYVERDVCPFECCQFGKWTAGETMAVYATEFDTTQVAFTVGVGDTFVAESGHLIWERFGKLLIREPVRSFEPGDTAIFLSSAGEEGFVIWEGGEFTWVREFWAPIEPGESAVAWEAKKNQGVRYPAIMIEHPRMAWWVRVRSGSGRTGWVRLENRVTHGFYFEPYVDGTDACG